MADEETATRLLVRIEVAQNKLDKQLAAVAKSASNGAANIEKSFKKAGTGVVQSVGAQRAAVSNLSFQLNDIAMGLASGTSPFTIMIQQGSQVAQALQGGKGLLGALKTVGGAFAQMVNPVSLASFAMIGAAGAAVAYFTSVGEDTPAADQLIKGHADFIRQIKDAYGEAAIGAENYSTTSKKILEFETRDKIKEFKSALTDAAGDLSGQLTSLSVDVFQGATYTIGEVNGAINKLNDSVAAGNPDIKSFIDRLIDIADQPGTPQQIRDIIKEIVEFW
ncbi:phage tail length tape measure family protein [Phyllobacterium sp. A18/5-2]|uniref:phage tail length tape measure family protein n=1 Tax=Phyllobacterium sp. A18/5-2 TaxID=2978392 RepID=UPI0021C84EBB|nr:phage tail length tape measure family protein [Phyllobacterium sp. A18/5-2]UXN62909.1 phage tail length tape measure family protein [Phyllobacterium sp. A18/5-2]